MKCIDCKRKEEVCEICGRPLYPYNGINQPWFDQNKVYCGGPGFILKNENGCTPGTSATGVMETHE